MNENDKISNDKDSTRVDKWLWAIRMTPTRQGATEMCHAGHVKVNGQTVKASHIIRPGNEISVKLNAGEKLLEVITIIEKRVGYQTAVTCYNDKTPPKEREEVIPPAFIRDRSSGRPTKKDRRELDKLRKQF
ncbi:MAG: RNA-binding S4 domain-containing protein [Firmicutes bacterium]|nr:RNA-binding S4 domain-containing protein [Bacillota bacterium]